MDRGPLRSCGRWLVSSSSSSCFESTREQLSSLRSELTTMSTTWHLSVAPESFIHDWLANIFGSLDVPSLLHDIHHHLVITRFRTKCVRHKRPRRPKRRGSLRGNWSDVCGHWHGSSQVVAWSVLTAPGKGEVAQDCHLGINGMSDGGVYLDVLCLLATVYATEVSVGPPNSRRILSYQFNSGVHIALRYVLPLFHSIPLPG
jgi:hypothetical protein